MMFSNLWLLPPQADRKGPLQSGADQQTTAVPAFTFHPRLSAASASSR